MRTKLFITSLSVALILSSLSSCGGKTETEKKDSTVYEVSETTQTNEKQVYENEVTSSSTEVTSEESESEFDFVKAIESTYICGQKLSYPLTWGHFGDDFEVDSDGSFSSKGRIICECKYKGQSIGDFVFDDCESLDMINEDTKILGIFIYDEIWDDPDVEKFTVNGLKPYDTPDDMYKILGNNYRIGVNETQIIYENGQYGGFVFHFDAKDDKEILRSVKITFCRNNSEE